MQQKSHILEFSSALVTAADFRALAQAVAEDPCTKVVVVPAMTEDGERGAASFQIADVHRWLAIEMQYSIAVAELDLGDQLDLHPHFESAWTKFRTGESSDYLMCRRSAMSAMIAASLLNAQYRDAAMIILGARDGGHSGDRIKLQVQKCIVESNSIVVVPSGYGKTYDGRLRLLNPDKYGSTGEIIASHMALSTLVLSSGKDQVQSLHSVV